MEALNEHLETLAGYVFDNDKLVTYKWLSKELHVHVNIAKQILWEFYQKYHTNNDIECTYLLMGLLKDNGMRVEVVKESAVSKAKEKFKKIISEHLYSVHKPLADLELLANSNSIGDINYSSIKCDACKERSNEEMHLLRWGTNTKKIAMDVMNSKLTDSVNLSRTEKNLVTAKKNGLNNLFNMPKKTKSPEKLKSLSYQEEDSVKKDEDCLKEADSTRKNKNFMENDNVLMREVKGLMEKEEDSKKKYKNCIQKDKDSIVDPITKKVSPKSNSVKRKNLDNFFGKSMSTPKPAEIKLLEKRDNKIEKEFIEKKKIEEKQNLRGKKRNRSKETADNTCKKRKRIVIQNDSSDSEVQSDKEMVDLIPEPEPEALVQPKSPSPPKVKHEDGKRKILKLVNRTYKEGEYIVTKKEHVYVSCSEDEEEKKEEEIRKEQKKVNTRMEKIKKKQSTLTDFFKKS